MTHEMMKRPNGDERVSRENYDASSETIVIHPERDQPHFEEYGASRIDVTAKLMTELLERAEPDLEVVRSLIETLAARGRSAEARALMRALIVANPDVAGFHTLLAQLLEGQDRYAEALSEYASALVTNPSDIETYVLRGALLLRRGQLARAKQDFLVAIALDPEGCDPNTIRAWSLRAEVTRAQRRLQKNKPRHSGRGRSSIARGVESNG